MTEEFRTPERGSNEEPGRDARLTQALRALDPGSTDRGYWPRFHRTVMGAARDELARRRMLADATVSDIVASWARTVVPTALLAAAVAALLLMEPVGEEFGQDVFRPERASNMEVTFASEGF